VFIAPASPLPHFPAIRSKIPCREKLSGAAERSRDREALALQHRASCSSQMSTNYLIFLRLIVDQNSKAEDGDGRVGSSQSTGRAYATRSHRDAGGSAHPKLPRDAFRRCRERPWMPRKSFCFISAYDAELVSSMLQDGTIAHSSGTNGAPRPKVLRASSRVCRLRQ
jgi:hypothetical protein